MTDIVRNLDAQALTDHIWERYEVGVTPDHAEDILWHLARHTSQAGADVCLKGRLAALGYLTPMFLGKDDDPKITWNELHIFVDEPDTYEWERDLFMEEPAEPQYARSKISRTEVRVVPINKTAHSVAPPPGDREWEEIAE